MDNTPLAGLSILVVEDEPLLRRHLAATLERLGADITSVDSVRGARQVSGELSFDYALVDVNLPDGRGTELLRDRAFGPGTGVVVMTAEGGVNGAVEAMKLGALDYLTKPFEPEALALVIQRARRTKQTARVEEHRRKDAPELGFVFGGALLGLEAQLNKILAADRRMQTSLPPVLIQGETGTGKTTIARWLHQNGPRATGPIVEMNCSAVPESLAESELFGHEKGAFTDARSARMGLFEAASGGTLFLDEVPSLSVSLQAKLLKTLEDRRVRRVGGNKEIPVDARVIAAANRDLKQLAAAGQFREDLYHRLDLFRVVIPPLRERGEDILKLAEALMVRLVQRHRIAAKPISAAGRRRLLAYAWPGNVRELAHELERALVFEDSDELMFDQLMAAGGSGSTATAPRVAPEEWFNQAFHFPDGGGFSLEDAILRLIHHSLAQTGGNVSAAARLLGVSRDYLRYRLSGQKTEGGPPEAVAGG